MNGFFITVKNGLLDPKHFKAMKGDKDCGVVWLFLWLLDKMTIIDHEKGEGKVLGGKPVKYEEVCETIQVSRRTYAYWIELLRSGSYITTKRTPYGLIITVQKAFKVFGQKTKRDVQQTAQLEDRDTALIAHHHTFDCTSNKTIQLDNTNIATEVASPKSLKETTNKKKTPFHAEAINLIVLYKTLFKKGISEVDPIFNMGQAIKMARERIKTLGEERMAQLLYAYLESNDPFYKENVYSITCFLSEKVVNKLNLTTKHGK